MKLGQITETACLIERLLPAGLHEPEALRLSALFQRAARALRRAGAGPATPVEAFFVPGRIEVLGKHTDYAGGRSLVCAVPYGFAVVAVAGPDATLTLHATASGEVVSFPVSSELPPVAGHWQHYPRTVARRLAKNFGPGLRGGALAFASDLPPAAGLSSSSAFVTAVFLALSALNGLEAHPRYRQVLASRLRLAAYLGAVESGRAFGSLAAEHGVGTQGGSEDHTAILCGAPDRLRLFAYTPVRLLRDLPMPPAHVFVVAASGVVAEKAGAARERYNRAARQAAAVVQAWNTATGDDAPHLGALFTREGFSPDRLRRLLSSRAVPDGLLDRFEHFFHEDRRLLPAAVEALEAGDLATFGQVAAESQSRAERLLGNQVPETIHLARAARDLGAVAASAFGAGFGGAVWALVPEAEAADFARAWQRDYLARFPGHTERAQVLITRPGPCAFALDDAHG
ncbi:MAG: galactokinase [Rhodothermaceae bacterium]|nr:MAG: galactokinase [Rhodothermaceae bacterium]